MHDRPESTPPPDLARYSEVTRRQLYDRIAAEHFNPPAEEVARALDRDEFVEARTAEDAGLVVAYLLGRWFAFWRLADPPENPAERELWEVVTVSAGSRGLSFSEV